MSTLGIWNDDEPWDGLFFFGLIAIGVIFWFIWWLIR